MTVSSPARRKRATGRLSLGDRLLVGFVGAFGPAVVRLLGASWRVRFVNAGAVGSVHASGRPLIYAFWHSYILPLGYTHRGRGVVVLSSWHRDGEITAHLLRALGFAVERGSTTRGSVRGVVRMVGRAREGRDLAITPDGPKGPARVSQTGAGFVSRRADAPIVALGVGVDRCRRLSGWDRFVIPYPFARIVVLHSDPIEIAEGQGLDAAASSLTAEIDRLCIEAQALAEEPSRFDALSRGTSGDAEGRTRE